MNIETLNEAIFEAQRFLKRAQKVQELQKVEGRIFFGSKETAAVKRASMDLSRTLTNIRKPVGASISQRDYLVANIKKEKGE